MGKSPVNDELSRRMKKALEGVPTLRELARGVGLHPVTLSRYLNGTRRPSPEIALKIAKALRRRSASLAKLAAELEAAARAAKKGGK